MKMSDELEKNLRARIETKRSVPGTVAIKGREFRYVLDDERMPFSKLFHELVVAGKRTATQGGVISENCEVCLPDGAIDLVFSQEPMGELESLRAREPMSGGGRKNRLVSKEVHSFWAVETTMSQIKGSLAWTRG